MNIHVKGALETSFAENVAIENDFDFLSQEYARLFKSSGATGFQNPLWLHSIYTILVPRLSAEPHIITVRGNSGELKMLIPLVRQQVLKVSILQPADLGISDYNCIVSDHETLERVAQDEDCKHRIRECLDASDILMFRKVPGSPAATAAILGQGTQSLNENAGNELTLFGETFDVWQKFSLKNSFRRSLNRRWRRLEADHDKVEFTVFKRAGDIENTMRFIREYRCLRFKDDVLKHDAYFDFYLHYALAGASSGAAVTSGLLIDGELVAADFGIASGDVHYSILCATRREEFGKYSPGFQALFALIKRSHAKGQYRVDLGLGDNRQKRDFAAQEIPLHNIALPKSIKGRMVSLIYHRTKLLKTLLRNLVGRIR